MEISGPINPERIPKIEGYVENIILSLNSIQFQSHFRYVLFYYYVTFVIIHYHKYDIKIKINNCLQITGICFMV